MGARLTFGMVLLAAVTLAAGYFSHTAWLIFISIACSVGAALGLWAGSRRRRRAGRVEADETLAWTASLAEPAVTAAVSVGPRSRAEADDGFADTEISRRPPGPSRGRTGPVAAVGSLVGAEAAGARRRQNAPSGRAAPLGRGAALDQATEAVDAVVGARAQPSPAPSRPAGPRPAAARAAPPVARPAPPGARVPAPAPAVRPAASAVPAPRPVAPAVRPSPAPVRRRPPVEDFPFPIEDYDYLAASDIIPLLPELDDQELVEVLLREHEGANRDAIMSRIDALLEGE